MVGEGEALRTMNDFDEDEQRRLVVEHITSTAIDCKPNMVGECEALRTMNDVDEDEQRCLVVEHITSTAIDCKPLRKFAQKHRIVERSYRKILRRQLCKMLYDLICAGVITDFTVTDKRGNNIVAATKSIGEAKVLEFDLWYKRIPCGRRAQLTTAVVIDETKCHALEDDLLHSLEILGKSKMIIHVKKSTNDKGYKMFDQWYNGVFSDHELVRCLLTLGSDMKGNK